MDTSEKPTEEQLAWSQEIPNYGNKLLKRLDEFRKTTILYDVRVRAEGGEFNAHKVILAACGGIFRTCFVDDQKKMISGECTELNLECPAQGLKPIIRFAYTGALVVTKRNAVATMIAAEVTKMKEVQEICADIAVKEYGWVVDFSGEKDSTVLGNLVKVLSLHATCFTNNSSVNGSNTSEDNELPFDTEVNKDYPEHATTYHKLAIKLKHAEDITAAKSKKNETPKAETTEKPSIKEDVLENNEKPKKETPETSDKESVDGKDADLPVTPKKSPPERPKPVVVKPKQETLESSEKESVDGKDAEQPVTPKKSLPERPKPVVIKPKQETLESSDKDPVDGKDAEQPAIPKKFPPEKPNPVVIKVTTVDSEETKPTEAAPKKEAPPPVPRVKQRSSVKSSKQDTPESGKDSVDGKDVEQPVASTKSPSEKPKPVAITLSADDSDETKSTEATAPKKEAPPPSPRVKPRASVKSKKAPPAPPTLVPADKPPRSPAPRRPNKQPAKVPPPRPKPPVKKKTSSMEAAAENAPVADDYDDSLNPFA